MFQGVVLAAADEAVGEALTVGVGGTDEFGPTVPTMDDTFAVGTAGTALTPRLLISIEPNGIPGRVAAPDAVGGVDVGDDDEAILLEPEPHVPDNPDVSSIPEDVDNPDVAEIADDVDTPEDADGVMLPVIVPVAGVVAPLVTPPPS